MNKVLTPRPERGSVIDTLKDALRKIADGIARIIPTITQAVDVGDILKDAKKKPRADQESAPRQ